VNIFSFPDALTEKASKQRMNGNLNSGKAWSEMDLADLRNAIRFGDSIEKMADFLCRGVERCRRAYDRIMQLSERIL